MLSKKYRLAKTTDINIVHKTGETFFTKHFVLKFSKNGLDYSRFTILISTKVSKNATVRNRVKRLLRERVKFLWSDIKPGYNLMLIVSKNIVGSDKKPISREDIWGSVDYAFKKSRLV